MARGFETIAVGQLVTADTINDKFIKQGVLYFASAAARDAAVTSPEEGMHAYLADANIVTEYTGSGWVFFGSPGPTTAGDTVYFDGTKWVRVPIGTALQQLRVNAGATAPEWASVNASAMTLEGSQLTEASTTSTTEVDVLSVSGLTIPAASPLYIVCAFRKTGANSGLRVGLKINSTTVVACDVSSTATAASTGVAIFEAGPATADHGQVMGRIAYGLAAAQFLGGGGGASRPNAEVTSVTIRGMVNNATDTLYVDELHVYALAAS